MGTQSKIIPTNNSIDAHVDNFHDAADPSTPITDATITFTIYNVGGDAVTSATSMPHIATGNYRGSVEPSPALTDGDRYRVVVTCSNYPAQWVNWFTAKVRPFSM